MSRPSYLKTVKENPGMRVVVKKMTEKDFGFIDEFLAKNTTLDSASFAKKVNRLFLDQPEKPKNHICIWAILNEMCSIEGGKK